MFTATRMLATVAGFALTLPAPAAWRLASRRYTQYSTRYDRRVEPIVSVPHALLALLSEGPKHGLRLQNEIRGADRRGLAAQRRAGLHDAPAPRARRTRRDRRRGERALAEALPDHVQGRSRAGQVATYPDRARAAAARRARDQGPGRAAGPRDRRARDHAGASPARDRDDAALHAGQGGGRGGRHGVGAGRRCRALPAGGDRPLARRRRRPLEAAADPRAPGSGRGSARTGSSMEVPQ